MDELKELKQRLAQERPAQWDGLPDISLYMDQIISYMPRQLIRYGEGENLTPAMVNNYIKDELLPRADGKKYNRTHLAYLTAICALKQTLSVKEIKTLLSEGGRDREAEQLYGYFCRAMDRTMTQRADALDDALEQDDLAKLALTLALESYTAKLACQRVLGLLKRDPPAQEKKKTKAKEG